MADTKKNAVWKCIVVLAAIALCSGLLLGFFNIITYVDPLQSAYDRRRWKSCPPVTASTVPATMRPVWRSPKR